MKLVVDASASLRAQIGGPGAGAVLNALEAAEHVATSALHSVEVCNGLWKYVRSGHLSQAEAEQMLGRIKDLIHETVPVEDNIAEAFAEAIRLDHPVYDLIYLALSRRRGAALLTVDGRLAKLAVGAGVAVADLDEPQGPTEPSAALL
ncbi:MAG: type II toxin-antitoxin system VapC family toxin [Bifidobacteriaceae bacterium]|jgi:predicted nucleic acid-binding protein|nr:type II toxin-antitoxin system VapC family toxin [Bifidobacteriaceae bacterium]